MNKKFTLVVNGKFHLFDVAAELYKKGLLKRVISSMPYFIAKRYGIGREVYVGLPIFEVYKRVWRKVFRREPSVNLYAFLFTKVSSFFVPKDTDVVIGLAGYSKEVFESTKLNRAIKILDRSSTHTLENINLKTKAAQYHNINWAPHPSSFIERELDEYTLADKILVPSGYVAKTFTKHGVNEDVLVKNPYAISKHRFQNIPSNTKKDKEKKIILFVGQLIPRKGIGVLIKATEEVVNKIPNVELWLVGAKSPKIHSNLLDKPWIKYWGQLKGVALIEKFQKADLFCLLSFEEGLAYVLTEALSFGLPIIATENTGVLELVKDDSNIHIVPLANHVVTADKILKVLNDKTTRDTIRRNSDNMNFYTWEKYVNKLLNEI